jgi:CRP-like cAMP-binding protein
MRNQALVQEARDSGVVISAEFHEEVADQLRRQLALLSALLGMPLDTLGALRALPAEARHDTVTVRVLDYLTRLSQRAVRMQNVPPFLADTLRSETRWEIVPAGVERVLERARQLRLALDTLPRRPTTEEPNAQ